MFYYMKGKFKRLDVNLYFFIIYVLCINKKEIDSY